MIRFRHVLANAAACALLVVAGSASQSATPDAPAGRDLSVRPAFAEPVVLGTKSGVLEVTLTARQGRGHLDTVATPVKDFLEFAYSVQRGSASNGKMSGEDQYPAPTLQVYPGQTLIVHFNNDLRGLTITDFFNPKYTPKGETVPTYPPMLTESPVNLHVHGVHISPKGNADNVLIDIKPGLSNTYVYHIPKNMPQGAYWYHSHLHTVASMQTYAGLAGLLEIGRVDGNLPVVTAKHLPIRNFILQYNAVFDRANGTAQLNNVNWSQYVSTLKKPEGSELADGTYQPLLAPVNFKDSKIGTRYATVWWAGPLSINNDRGLFQFVPSNLQSFAASDGSSADALPANPGLPDYQRDVQYTVNGQFQPVVKMKPGQTEIWVLSNISDFAYENVQLTETATGKHPRIAIVGQDGNPYPAVHVPPTKNGTELLIPPASRFAIAVTMPREGGLTLAMPALGRGAKVKTAPGVMYTNNGATAPGVLGSISVLPSAMSYNDGFFVFPTQVLARAVPASGIGETVAFAENQPLHAFTSFDDLSRVKPDVKRTLVINGGFLNEHANPNDPKSFVYAFGSKMFPNVPLIQPRLHSVEEWNFVNDNNDEHPIHVHVNDFQVTAFHDPTTGLTLGPQMYGADNFNVPAPSLGPNESVISPGTTSIRTKFEDMVGLYVMHCHRMNHEDNGLMALVNVIPAVSSYAVVVPGSKGRAATVKIYDGNGDRLIATVTPFPNSGATPSVAMGDLDGDGVLDLIAGAGAGMRGDVAVFSGSTASGAAFSHETARFTAFPAARGGISVAAALIDGSDTADNIIVGSGAGASDSIHVYRLHAGATPALFSSYAPFAGDRSGVSVAAGTLDAMSGRASIAVAPGPGAASVVRVLRYSLLTRIGERAALNPVPESVTSFAPFGDRYRGGVSLGVGWLAGALGGAQSIAVGQLAGGSVKVYSAGNELHGAPMMYLMGPAMDDMVEFGETASFRPFGVTKDVHVATTATTDGANLLVSGKAAGESSAHVMKYELVRTTPTATSLAAKTLHLVSAAAGPQPGPLAGN